MNQNNQMATYAQMGMAALLPGMQYAVELMQRQLDEFRAQLAALQNGSGPKPKTKPKAETAETVIKDQRLGPNRHPRNPDHPDHAKWVAKMRKNQKKHWDALTPAQRQARLKKMHAGRTKQAAQSKIPAVKLIGAA